MLISEKSTSRLTWLRVVPGTYCVTESAFTVAEYALKGVAERSVRMPLLMMPQGS